MPNQGDIFLRIMVECARINAKPVMCMYIRYHILPENIYLWIQIKCECCKELFSFVWKLTEQQKLQHSIGTILDVDNQLFGEVITYFKNTTSAISAFLKHDQSLLHQKALADNRIARNMKQHNVPHQHETTIGTPVGATFVDHSPSSAYNNDDDDYDESSVGSFIDNYSANDGNDIFDDCHTPIIY